MRSRARGALPRLLLRVSWPHMRQHKVRTALTLFGISLGVGVLIAVLLVSRSVLGSFERTVDAIAGKADLQVSSGGGGLSDELVYDLKAIPGVWKATPVLEVMTDLQTPEGPRRFLVLGVDFLGPDDGYFRAYGRGGQAYGTHDVETLRRDPIAFLNSPTHLLLSRRLMKDLGLSAPTPDSPKRPEVTVGTPAGFRAFKIWGSIDDQGPGAAFGGSVAVMYYQAAQVAFDRGRLVDRYDVAVRPGHDPNVVAAAIRAELGEGIKVEAPAWRTRKVERLLRSFRLGLLVGSLVALMVGVFLIFNALSISVVQRRREIGILRGLGLTRGETRRLFVAEGTLLGLLGSAAGCGLGVLLARGVLGAVSATVSQIYVQVDAQEVQLRVVELVAGFAMGVGVSFAAALWPAHDAARTPPAHVMREGHGLGRQGRARRAADLGALGFGILFVLACFVPPFSTGSLSGYAAMFLASMVGALLSVRAIDLTRRLLLRPASAMLGAVGRIAVDSLGRDRARTGIAVGALVLGVSMTVSLAGFLGSFRHSVDRWLDQSMPADLYITAGNKFGGVQNIPMEGALATDLARIPGVEAIDSVRIVPVDMRGETARLLSLDALVYGRYGTLDMVEGQEDEALAAAHRGEGVLVSENLSNSFGLHLGDPLTLDTPSGRRSWPVVGVYFDYTSEVGLISMERQVYEKVFGDTKVDTFELYLRAGTSPAAIRRVVEASLGQRFPLFILTNADMKREVHDTVNEAFRVTQALELVALIIALLGIVNTLLAEVIDRTRVLGIMRAVGATRRQIARMMITEATLMGLVAVVLGVLLGLAQAWVVLERINFPQTGWRLHLTLPWLDVAEVAVLTCAVSALAGWYPARRAARLRVVEAIDYE